MRELNNPHDKFFKELMSDHERAVTILKAFLPLTLSAQIDFSSIKKLDGTFVSSDQSFFKDYLCIQHSVDRFKKRGGRTCIKQITELNKTGFHDNL